MSKKLKFESADLDYFDKQIYSYYPHLRYESDEERRERHRRLTEHLQVDTAIVKLNEDLDLYSGLKNVNSLLQKCANLGVLDTLTSDDEYRVTMSPTRKYESSAASEDEPIYLRRTTRKRRTPNFLNYTEDFKAPTEKQVRTNNNDTCSQQENGNEFNVHLHMPTFAYNGPKNIKFSIDFGRSGTGLSQPKLIAEPQTINDDISGEQENTHQQQQQQHKQLPTKKKQEPKHSSSSLSGEANNAVHSNLNLLDDENLSRLIADFCVEPSIDEHWNTAAATATATAVTATTTTTTTSKAKGKGRIKKCNTISGALSKKREKKSTSSTAKNRPKKSTNKNKNNDNKSDLAKYVESFSNDCQLAGSATPGASSATSQQVTSTTHNLDASAEQITYYIEDNWNDGVAENQLLPISTENVLMEETQELINYINDDATCASNNSNNVIARVLDGNATATTPLTVSLPSNFSNSNIIQLPQQSVVGQPIQSHKVLGNMHIFTVQPQQQPIPTPPPAHDADHVWNASSSMAAETDLQPLDLSCKSKDKQSIAVGNEEPQKPIEREDVQTFDANFINDLIDELELKSDKAVDRVEESMIVPVPVAVATAAAADMPLLDDDNNVDFVKQSSRSSPDDFKVLETKTQNENDVGVIEASETPTLNNSTLVVDIGASKDVKKCIDDDDIIKNNKIISMVNVTAFNWNEEDDNAFIESILNKTNLQSKEKEKEKNCELENVGSLDLRTPEETDMKADAENKNIESSDNHVLSQRLSEDLFMDLETIASNPSQQSSQHTVTATTCNEQQHSVSRIDLVEDEETKRSDVNLNFQLPNMFPLEHSSQDYPTYNSADDEQELKLNVPVIVNENYALLLDKNNNKEDIDEVEKKIELVDSEKEPKGEMKVSPSKPIIKTDEEKIELDVVSKEELKVETTVDGIKVSSCKTDELLNGLSVLEMESKLDEVNLTFDEDDAISLATSCFNSSDDERLSNKDDEIVDKKPKLNIETGLVMKVNMNEFNDEPSTSAAPGGKPVDANTDPKFLRSYKIPLLKRTVQNVSTIVPQPERPAITENNDMYKKILPPTLPSTSVHNPIVEAANVFGVTCFPFLADKCLNPSMCKYSHEWNDHALVVNRLEILSADCLEFSYKFAYNHKQVFQNYFLVFCKVYIHQNNRSKLLNMIHDIQRYSDCAAYLYIIFNSLVQCGLAKANACRQMLSRCAKLSTDDRRCTANIDILISIIMESDWKMFTNYLERFADLTWYKYPPNVLDQMAPDVARNASLSSIFMLCLGTLGLEDRPFAPNSPTVELLLQMKKLGRTYAGYIC